MVREAPLWLLGSLVALASSSFVLDVRVVEGPLPEKTYFHSNDAGRSKRQAYMPFLHTLLGVGGPMGGPMGGYPPGQGLGPPNPPLGPSGAPMQGTNNVIQPDPSASSMPGPQLQQQNPMQNMAMQMFCQYFCEELLEQMGPAAGALYQSPKITCFSPDPPVIKARSNESSALVKWWPPVAYDSEGRAIQPRQVNGLQAPWGMFAEGNHTVRYSVTDESTGYSASCSVQFRVEVTRCPKPYWPPGGWRECDSDVIFGSQCRFGCMPGYELVGSPQLTCMENGLFNFAPPQCQLKSCPPPELPPHALSYRCTNGNFYNSVCYLLCDTLRGFEPTMPAVRTCLPVGQWTNPGPTCKSSAPPKFTNCPSASIQVLAERGGNSATVTWPEPVAQDVNGAVAVQQVEGPPPGSSFPLGTHKVRYATAATEGGPVSSCSFAVVVDVLSCPPPAFQDKYLKSNCSQGFIYGSNCSLECSMGIPLEGASSVSCELGEMMEPRWTYSGAPPRCAQRACADLRTPANGAMVCDQWAGGTLCQMQCSDRYDVPRTLAAASHYVCAFSTGKWSPSNEVPDCTELRRPNLMVLPSELFYYSGNCSDPAMLTAIKKQFIQSLMNSSSWRQVCEKDKSCNANNVRIECGQSGGQRRRRGLSHLMAQQSPSAAIVTWDFTVQFSMGNMSVREAIELHDRILKNMARAFQGDLNRGQFNINVSGFDSSRSSFAYGWTDFVCDKGLLPVYTTASCAACPAGTFFKDRDCLPCLRGTYQPNDAATSCIPCPPGMTTLHTGARNASLCIRKCAPGTWSPSGTTPCSPCLPATYQPAEGKHSCLPCPVGTKTEHPGSKEAGECKTYDIVVMGPETVTFKKPIKQNLENFTFTFWFKANDAGRKSTSFTFKDDTNNTFVLDFSPLTSLFKLTGGDVKIPFFFTEEMWSHVAVTWEGGARELVFYVDGQYMTRKSFPAAPPVLLGEGTRLELGVGFKSATTLQGLSLLPELRTSGEVKVMASSCGSQDEAALISLDDLPLTSHSEILVFTPSSCLGPDYCHPDPCNGHECTSTAAGYNCTCRGGYSGVNCSVAPDPCLENLCANGATCATKGDNYTCVCPEDFIGHYCESPIVHGQWGRWTEWSSCTVTCGDGQIMRTRSCDNPPPGPGGRSCEGNSTELQPCRNFPCHACLASDLERSYGTRQQCSGDASSLTCSVTCRAGLTFLETPPTYRCTGGRWYPSKKVVPCTRASSPRRLELRFQGVYDSQDCITAADAARMEQTVTSQLTGAACVAERKCASLVHIQPTCPAQQTRVRRSERRPIEFSVALAIDFDPADLDLENLSNLGSANERINSLIAAIDSLERTAKQLQESNFELLGLELGGSNYSVSGTNVTVTPQVTCPPGSFPRNAICLECPVGTHMGEKECKLCDVGTYQDETGSLACKVCSTGLSTEYKGATTSKECRLMTTTTVSTTSASTTTTTATTTPTTTATTNATTTRNYENEVVKPSKEKKVINKEVTSDPKGDNSIMTKFISNVPVIAGSIGALLFLLVLSILIALACRRRRNAKKATEPQSRPSWVESFSAATPTKTPAQE